MIVLYILLFIVCLSTLIMVHELGHLLTAKMFKVYCFEYSIGFGPKLLSFKRKQGETYFSLRAIPFGGYVSMYGEKEIVPEGFEDANIDPSRSLFNIKKWKRAIVLAAGVTMNFILALLVFFVYEFAFPAYTPRYAHVSVNGDSKAYEVGLRTGDFIYASVSTPEDRSFVFYDNSATISYSDSTTKTAYFGFDYSTLTYKDTSLVNRTVAYETMDIGSLNILDYQETTVGDIIAMETSDSTKPYKVTGFISALGIDEKNQECKYLITDNFGEEKDKSILVVMPYSNEDESKTYSHLTLGEELTVIGDLDFTNAKYKILNVKEKNYLTKVPNFNGGNLLKKKDNISLSSISFTIHRTDPNDLEGKGKEAFAFNNLEVVADGDYYKLKDNIGLNMQIEQNYNSFPEAFKNTFVDFGEGATLIFRSLWTLLTDASSWKDVGGIVSIGVVTTQVLQNFGWGEFLRLWALISVNLGIVNLLPFPGLDGWQLLVTAIEGIFKKEIPSKVKNWVSIVGIALLFGLMIIILIKDVVALF